MWELGAVAFGNSIQRRVRFFYVFHVELGAGGDAFGLALGFRYTIDSTSYASRISLPWSCCELVPVSLGRV